MSRASPMLTLQPAGSNPPSPSSPTKAPFLSSELLPIQAQRKRNEFLNTKTHTQLQSEEQKKTNKTLEKLLAKARN